MSILQVNKYSMALSRFITFHVILPDDAPGEEPPREVRLVAHDARGEELLAAL